MGASSVRSPAAFLARPVSLSVMPMIGSSEVWGLSIHTHRSCCETSGREPFEGCDDVVGSDREQSLVGAVAMRVAPAPGPQGHMLRAVGGRSPESRRRR